MPDQLFKKTIFPAIWFSLAVAACGQTNTDDSEEQSVRAVVETYIAGTYEADADKLRGAFADNAAMSGYLDGQLLEGTPEPFIQDVTSKPSLKSSGAGYEANIEHVSITGNVASVVMRETGFGPFNFTNYFHLLQKNGEWKIVSKTFTSH